MGQWLHFRTWVQQARTPMGRLALILLVLLGVLVLAGLPVVVLGKAFDRLEEDFALKDAQRVAEGVQNEVQVLDSLVKDWAAWDDAYSFIEGRNPAFPKINLDRRTLRESTRIHLVYLLDRNQKILFGEYLPHPTNETVQLEEFRQDQIRKLPVMALSQGGTGILLTTEGPLMIAARPIHPSSHAASSNGTLIMGRLLDRERLQEIAMRLSIPFERLKQPMSPAAWSQWEHRGWKPWIQPLSREKLDLLVAIPDLRGTDRMVLRLPWDRTIRQEGWHAERMVFISIFLAVLVIAAGLLAAFRLHMRLVQKDQERLEEAIQQRTSELQHAERRFRAFIDHTHDVMFWCGRKDPASPFLIEGINPAALRLIALPLVEVLGHPLRACMPAPLGDLIEQHVQECCYRKEPVITEDTVELQGLRRVFHTVFVPAPDEHGVIRLVAGSARDITAHQEREEALLHAQKLESLGVLAGGIAHDFNNLLTAAQGNLDIVTTLIEEDPPAALAYVQSVQGALTRAAHLTRQMLAYSGRGRFVIKVHDLNTTIQDMTALLDVSISKKAALAFTPARDLPPMEADSAQIQQVVMNLVTNASDALQDKVGEIRIRTWAETMDEAAISALPTSYMRPGLHVGLEIADTGCGIPRDRLARIFEPFYSTKGTGRGLGLSAMLGILRSHRGGLRILSEEGQGTTFQLWFPALEPADRPQAPPDPAESNPPDPGQEPLYQARGILLVEDDPDIRSITGKHLRSLGLTVIEAGDGLEGLDQFTNHRELIQLILLDLTMPRMDGREFLTVLRAQGVRLPVIVSSGYTDQELPTGDPLLSFLQKPYQAADLKEAIRHVLRPDP